MKKQQSLIASDQLRVIVGLGKTGLACARFLQQQGIKFIVVDSRESPPELAVFRAEFPLIQVYLGGIPEEVLSRAAELIVSPGVPLTEPAIANAKAKGVRVIGDIELFGYYCEKPIIAITGSNGKSTVTTMMGDMCKAAGLKTGVGGNLGVPALSLLAHGFDIFVLELSSFQLETVDTFSPAVSTILNISPDHMDRYPSLMAYHQAKQKIYRNCKAAVSNKDDALTQPLLPQHIPHVTFTLHEPDLKEFGIIEDSTVGGTFLAKGQERLLDTRELKIVGHHNYANALAAFALGFQVGLPVEAMCSALREYKGLPHRCEWVAEKNTVIFINDSKATNVGAASAALEGIGSEITGKIILIVGGDGKNADFDILGDLFNQYCRYLVAIGRDAKPLLAVGRSAGIPGEEHDSLQSAVFRAAEMAQPGDVVLLSPACASLDMFANYEARGNEFCQWVRELVND
ncbi:UDP-N-acetylmuramoyl-L-alanine--D-glutamate ligase [Zooshikella harenae]|uniref:UDP-N-acetylmuramoylalanine--D-glutamate ligase n=1 Tax=Zooshikella harenae TaxID=2827238 RepID=A0ABS5Z851_9GAMM|nr:UDP-N-acetylmuramoyl-L-alanine--D-glutamate ligase [Zooshikella harenae]MBU2710226.1 UDP-N-acetylmuramoyl-L-alanine--D-glutamate ligase [Zooshikella harenae]